MAKADSTSYEFGKATKLTEQLHNALDILQKYLTITFQ